MFCNAGSGDAAKLHKTLRNLTSVLLLHSTKQRKRATSLSFGATFEQLFEKLRAAFGEISSNLCGKTIVSETCLAVFVFVI